MSLCIVILAAGQGKRMMSDLPKVMHCLGGIPLLEHVIHTAQKLDSRKIQVVCGKGRHMVQEAFAHLPVQWVEQAEQRGTGHAVQQALSDWDDNDRILILYGDVPLVRVETLRSLLETVPEEGVGILVARVHEPMGLGRIIRDAQGNIVAIVEDRDATDSQKQISEINTGIMLCSARLLKRWLPLLRANNKQGEYYLTDMISMAVQEQVVVHDVFAPYEYEIQGVNHFWELAKLERCYQREYAKKLSYNGVKILDPSRIDIRGVDIKVSSGVVIDINVILEGRVTLHRGVCVGAHCILKNCEIGESAVIEPYTFIDGAIIAAGSRIGPFSRLRPGTVIEENAKVGNFVEIKNTRVGVGSKVNHLAYLGDCDMGAGVNIGAGTITCNYDGVNKWRTEIQDEAFIGSNTALVAPVIVGKKAVIGAGSVVTKDAPAEQLTLSRAPQKTIHGWKRIVKK